MQVCRSSRPGADGAGEQGPRIPAQELPLRARHPPPRFWDGAEAQGQPGPGALTQPCGAGLGSRPRPSPGALLPSTSSALAE